MRIESVYFCEICNTEYHDEAEALACEATGFPLPMPFLKLNTLIPAFGENGVCWGRIRIVHILPGHNEGVHFLGHQWWLSVSACLITEKNKPIYAPSNVNHNLGGYGSVSEGLIPAKAFDPREGYDAFRYNVSPEDYDVWETTMLSYGFKFSEASEYVMNKLKLQALLAGRSDPLFP